MKQLLLFIVPLVIAAAAIKVPVDYSENKESAESNRSHTENIPIYYTRDETGVDSYLIPPDPHKPEEVLPNTVVTPATYLLPPSPDQEPATYYTPTESGDQSDWYPIAQEPVSDQPVKLLPLKVHSHPIPILNQSRPYKNPYNPRTSKVINVQVPSIQLEPPAEDAPNDYIITEPSKELELPAEEIDTAYRPYDYYSDGKVYSDEDDTLSHLVPPKRFYKHKNPTKLYPKKFHGAFKPVPIPIGQFAADTSLEVPKAKPAKHFQPLPGLEPGPILTPNDEKRFYQFQLAEQKRKLKQEGAASQEATAERPNDYEEVRPTEQIGSETNHRYPEHNVYRPTPAPLKQKAAASQTNEQAHPAPDNRTEFRMHGMKGPHSYQFGYDTGKGKNRQFRYEERDNDGLVRGHYGYVDKFGKLRVVNYRAHPELGFQAEPQEENKEE